jgi:predicted nucleic acid-binding protein
MVKAVFDTNVLVSAFLTRHHPGGVSSELLRFVIDATIDLYLSTEIVDEVVATLSEVRFQQRYPFLPQQVGQYRADLLMLAYTVDDPPPQATHFTALSPCSSPPRPGSSSLGFDRNALRACLAPRTDA